MPKAPRVVQTPGAAPAETVQPEPTEPNTAIEGADPQAAATPAVDPDELPPDVQRIIDQRVDQRLAEIKQTERRAKLNPATGRDDLPTQEELLPKVKADPKRRALLSRDGWVTAPMPAKERDESGFAKV